MRSKEYLNQDSKNIIDLDLLNIYNILNTSKNCEHIDILIKNHKKLIDNLFILGKKKYKTVDYLKFFEKNYLKNKSEALNNFMCMLNNKNLLN